MEKSFKHVPRLRREKEKQNNVRPIPTCGVEFMMPSNMTVIFHSIMREDKDAKSINSYFDRYI